MLFAERLHALRDGRLPFADFYRATRNLWLYMGGRLLRQRNPGIGVDVEDVAQEMVVAAWRILPRWDPARGVGIDRYVIFNANSSAAHWLDAQREACQGGRLADNPNRAPRLGGTDTVEREAWAGTIAAWQPDAEELVDTSRLVLPRRLSRLDRLVVEGVIATGSLEATALYIYNHYPYRIALELGSEQAAARLVRRTAARLCDEPAFIRLLEEDDHG